MGNRAIAVGLLGDVINKMDVAAEKLETDEERKTYEIVRDLVSLIGIVAIDATYGET